MTKIYTKKKIEILGISISIRISYKSSKKFEIKKFTNPAIAVIALLCVVSISNSIYGIPAYFTKTSTLLSGISPSLSQLDENNIPPKAKIGDGVIFHGPTDTKQVALTFDADMTPAMISYLKNGTVTGYYNKKVIDVLNSTHTKATLFLTGMWIEQYPRDTRSLGKNPLFELGNHSYSHPSFDGNCFGLSQISDSKDNSEITKTQNLLRDIGQVDSTIFRFPGGCYSNADLKYVTQEKLNVVHWDVAGQDGFNENTESIVRNVVRNTKNGSIIVLHMNGYPNSPKTADALPKIISILKNKGYDFVKVTELLNPVELTAVNIRDFINHEYGL